MAACPVARVIGTIHIGSGCKRALAEFRYECLGVARRRELAVRIVVAIDEITNAMIKNATNLVANEPPERNADASK
jgi:hypothetical protein